jgi:hypothetical protein
MISTTHTLDGVKVTQGLLVWDYDLRVRMVGERNDLYRKDLGLPLAADPWYTMTDPVTGHRGSDMNCSRMWANHPSTGEPAVKAASTLGEKR